MISSMNKLLEVFPWNEKFTTGIPLIDDQHQQLVYLLNLLASGLANQADNSALNEILTELSEYAVYHFQTEEKVWSEYFSGDSLEADHKKEHDNFVSKVFSLKEEESVKLSNQVFEDILSYLTIKVRS